MDTYKVLAYFFKLTLFINFELMRRVLKYDPNTVFAIDATGQVIHFTSIDLV